MIAMKKIIKVNNVNIGSGIPKICVPIVGSCDDDIISQIRRIKGKPYDMIEWRMDYYDEVFDNDKVKSILEKIRKEIDDTILLCTFRTKAEGGEKAIDNNSYIELYKVIIDTQSIDFIDVEMFLGEEVAQTLVEYAHEKNVYVIMSNHDFQKTPSKAEIIDRLITMQSLGADIPKIAVMPRDTTDVLTLLTATDEMNREYADRPIITMSMSALGVISRIAGETFGSCITFGAGEQSSAPGQVEVKALSYILDNISAEKK